jgi:CHAT domain-containing protein
LATVLAATTDDLPPARRLILLPSPALAGIPVEALLAPDDLRIVSYAPSATVWKYLREQPRLDRHAGLLAVGDPDFKRSHRSSQPKPLSDHGFLVHFGVIFDRRPAAEAITEELKLQQAPLAARSDAEDFDPLPGTRYEVEALARIFRSADRPIRALFGAEASEPELNRLAASGELGRFGFIHLATHGLIDRGTPTRSAVILSQTGLPDPLAQPLSHQPVFDGRITVREIQRGWSLKAELVTLSACETALGRYAGGEGFVGFTQALLMSGARSVCLSVWKVDDMATALLMRRFYQNLLGKRPGLTKPLPKAEALAEAKRWLRNLTESEMSGELATLVPGQKRSLGQPNGPPPAHPDRGKERPLVDANGQAATRPAMTAVRPYAHPDYWAAFVLVGDPD